MSCDVFRRALGHELKPNKKLTPLLSFIIFEGLHDTSHEGPLFLRKCGVECKTMVK